MSEEVTEMRDGEEGDVEKESGRHQHCRMYERKFPMVDEVVVVEIARITKPGVYVRLLEYNNLEGLIQKNQLSKQRLRASVSTIARVGKRDVAVVLSVDEKKGYIDLSKARVDADDKKECEERWAKSKFAHSIIQNLSEKTNIPMVQLYERFGWEMYKHYSHASEGFEDAHASPEKFFERFDVPEEAKAELVHILEHKLAARAMKLRAEINVTCLSEEGVEGIKKALEKGEELSTEEYPIEIRLISAPRFSLSIVTFDREAGVARIEQVCEAIKAEIESRGGAMDVAKKAFVEADK